MWGLNSILKNVFLPMCASAAVQPVTQSPNTLPVILGPVLYLWHIQLMSYGFYYEAGWSR